MDLYQMTFQQMSESASNIKDHVCVALAKEGYLTEERAAEFMENFAVVVHEKNFLGRTIDRILGLGDGRYITVVKIIKTVPEKKKE